MPNYPAGTAPRRSYEKAPGSRENRRTPGQQGTPLDTPEVIQCIDCDTESVRLNYEDPPGWGWVIRPTPSWAWDAYGDGPYLACPECYAAERAYLASIGLD